MKFWPDLLVSVRSAAEAEAAVLGGADLIDIKEPASGPLGKAPDNLIDEILSVVNGRRLVSAAYGEWIDRPAGMVINSNLKFVKWGLAGARGRLAETFSEIIEAAGPRGVLVHYADCDRANSPTLHELRACLESNEVPYLLIDTFIKDGRGLLDWIPLPELRSLVTDFRSSGTSIALAGSLDAATITKILPLRPDWIAVRGAACDGGRNGTVSAVRVAELTTLIRARFAD